MAESCKPKVVVIGGPTASGKTALSLAVARRFGGEVISADSMQIYRGLDVGTAKATAAEQAEVPHHLLDIRNPEQAFSVAEYVKLADESFESCSENLNLEILVDFVLVIDAAQELARAHIGILYNFMRIFLYFKFFIPI